MPTPDRRSQALPAPHTVRDASQRALGSVLFLTLVWASGPTHGEPQPATEAAATSAPSEPGGAAEPRGNLTEATITATQHSARATMTWLARRVDGWFGDIPFEQGGRISHGELGWNVFKRTDQEPTQAFRFTARFRLPNVEAKRYVFVGNDDRQAVIEDRPDTLSRRQQLLRNTDRDNAFFAGVGQTLLDTIDLRLGLRGGLKPYAQARYKTTWQLSERNSIEFRETLFYSLSDRLGSTTSLSAIHAVSPTLNLRWLSTVTATQQSDRAAWSSNLGTYKAMGPGTILAFEAIWSGVVGSSVAVADYGLQARWRQPLHDESLFGELLVGHFWPRRLTTEPRERAWAVGADLRLRF